jgi:hypothetical protein
MVHTTPNARGPHVIAFPLAGLTPGDPRLIPGLTLALPPSQRRELAEALQRAPRPQQLIERLRQALQHREPLARIIERLAREPALLPQPSRADDPPAPTLRETRQPHREARPATPWAVKPHP